MSKPMHLLVAQCGEAAAALAVLDETATIFDSADHHDFVFTARAGVRYDVDVRVAAGAGGTVRVGDASRRNAEPSCRCNGVYNVDGVRGSTCDARTVGYDDVFAPVDCSGGCLWCYVRPGACSDGVPSTTNPGNEYSTLACAGVTAAVPMDGVSVADFWILPPGATEREQAVASQTTTAADKGLGFTAAATGDFTARVTSYEGSGPVSLRVAAVGTAEQRSPLVAADGAPRALEIRCSNDRCGFGYAGAAVYDADGGGFDLRLPGAEAGTAYALSISLPPGQAAAQVTATFYQADAAAGAAGFKPTVGGALGVWPTTPPGHQSYAEHHGCSNADRSCVSNIRASYGIHPGGRFGSVLKGTWVEPAGGVWLLRVVANCAVPFYHDAQAQGCHIDADGYGCQRNGDGTHNSKCASALQLTVTPDAYFDDSEHADNAEPSGHGDGDSTVVAAPVSGGAERTDTIVVSREHVEAMAAAMFDATPPQERTVAAPPTLEEMLVAGTPANAMLSSMLTAQQQPHVVYPLAIERVSGTSEGTAGQGHRLRQLQGAEPEPEPEDEAIAVRASLKIKATTGQHAAQLASHLVSLYPD